MWEGKKYFYVLAYAQQKLREGWREGGKRKKNTKNNFTSKTRQRKTKRGKRDGKWAQKQEAAENRKNETKIKLTRMEAHKHTHAGTKNGNDVVVKDFFLCLTLSCHQNHKFSHAEQKKKFLCAAFARVCVFFSFQRRQLSLGDACLRCLKVKMSALSKCF